ncbi:MAG TPA: hypothetical protein VE028_03845 [Nitratidesulfovibrio sp.]|nr:hypothetical protein [Nitratidesulfovibrio sp.]
MPSTKLLNKNFASNFYLKPHLETNKGTPDGSLCLIIATKTPDNFAYISHTTLDEASKHLAKKTEEWDETYTTFIEIIISQKKLLHYNSDYISYLLNQTTEEEFENSMEEFAKEKQRHDPTTLKRRIDIVRKHFGDIFDTSDIADIFNCDNQSINDALASPIERSKEAPSPRPPQPSSSPLNILQSFHSSQTTEMWIDKR